MYQGRAGVLAAPRKARIPPYLRSKGPPEALISVTEIA